MKDKTKISTESVEKESEKRPFNALVITPQKIEALHKYMEKVRRDYIIKEFRSVQNAKNMILTC